MPASESARASSGSDAAAKDLGAEMAAPYGTRSRNKTSNARPNYAEDKDIDMDNYDFYRGKDGHEGSKKSARHAHAAAVSADAPPRNGCGSRKSGVDDGRAAGPSQNGFKDQSSTSGIGDGGGGGGGGGGGATGASQPVQAAQPSGAPQPSRKRKAAAAGTTRRASNAAQSTGPPALRETNMMTFQKCDSWPRQGRMMADDGTVLEPNGKSSNPHTPRYQRHGEDPPTLRGCEGNSGPGWTWLLSLGLPSHAVPPNFKVCRSTAQIRAAPGTNRKGTSRWSAILAGRG